jgi:hypothetical protein
VYQTLQKKEEKKNEKYKRKKKKQEKNLNFDYQNINRKLVGKSDIIDVILIIF